MLQTIRDADGSARSLDFDEQLVSVIIPSKDSELTIERCLKSIIAQSYKPIEVIVVDCFSADSTRVIAESLGAQVIPQRSERSAARNLGAKFAKGEYLYFVDADHTLNCDVIATCVRAIQTADAVLVNDQDVKGSSKTSRLIASRRRVLSHDSLNIAPRFIRKAVFEELGGFDAELVAGEDLDLYRRFLLHHFKMAYSEAIVWHLGSPVDLTGLLSRSMYYSSTYLKYASRNPLISLKRLNPLRIVAAWKKSDTRGPDLLPIILLGFLLNAFLIICVLLNWNPREGTQKKGVGS